MNRFDQTLRDRCAPLTRATPEILQLNVGKLCNLTCAHCHVNAGPKRKEIITRETLDRIIDWFEASPLTTLDLTGGAPEMIPDFRHLIERVATMTPKRKIMDRCNLTILLESGYEDMAELLAKHEVEIVASMPCYSAKNVNAQRGDGVFDASITALQRLNALGYGINPQLPLHLVYNPLGDFLPGDQAELEADYHRELATHFGIVFNRLYTITNMPIARFASWLRHEGKYDSYLALLIDAFNPAAVDALMCRNTINVGWRGEVYDCDFNQQLNLQLRSSGQPLYLWDIDLAEFANVPILTGAHCFGCTAGAGSSCGGALTETAA
jgi:radical SAM/Cys-rich protein